MDDKYAGKMMIMTDNPKHARMRALVTSGFTPSTLAKLDDDVRLLAKEIVDEVADLQEFDFVEKIARELPLQVICAMVGVPREDRGQLIEWLDRAWRNQARASSPPTISARCGTMAVS